MYYIFFSIRTFIKPHSLKITIPMYKYILLYKGTVIKNHMCYCVNYNRNKKYLTNKND